MKDDLLEGLRPGFYADWAENLKFEEEALRTTSENRIRLMRFVLRTGVYGDVYDKRKFREALAVSKIMTQLYQEMAIAFQHELEEED